MNRHLVIAAGLALSLLMCFASNISLAQEEEELEFSYGVVRSLSSNELVVREDDDEGKEVDVTYVIAKVVRSLSSNELVVRQYDDEGKEIDVTYVIAPKVELKNANGLKDIAVGDSVEVEYVVKDGKKVAKIITVDKEA